MTTNERDHAGPPLATVTHERGSWIVEIAGANASRQRFVCASEASARHMQRAFERGGAAKRP